MKPLFLPITVYFCIAGIFLLTNRSWAQSGFKDFKWLETAPENLSIEAARLDARDGGKQVLFSGGVHVSGKDLNIWAEWMELFLAEEKVIISGGVRVVEGETVLLGERLELNQKQSLAVIRHAVILVKQGVSKEVLSKLKPSAQLVSVGNNALTLSGSEVIREKGCYRVDGARFTVCDCGMDEAPSWELRALQADILPEERAWLTFPILYLKGIPVFILPVAYLPLSERRTGLLFPQVNYSGRDGMVLSESFFLTLGRSADTTASLDWFEQRGFRERLELRAVPSPRSNMELRLSHLFDQKKKDLSRRVSVELDAFWRDLKKFQLNASIRLYSDSDLYRDFMSELAGRATDQAPSTLVLLGPGSDTVWSVDGMFQQDLRFGGVDLWSSQADDTIQRLGAISFHLAPVQPFGWPWQISLQLEGVNFSSLSAAWRDWGMDGIADAKEPWYSGAPADRSVDNGPGGEGDSRLSAGELRRAFRFLVQPQIHLPLQFYGVLRSEIDLVHRQMVYLPHGPQAPDPSTQGISFVRLALGTELSRSFGDDEFSIGHRFAPWLEFAGAWQGLVFTEARPYFDFQDRLQHDAQQLRLVLDNAWARKSKGSGYGKFLDFKLIQCLDLSRGSLGQLAGDLKLNLKPFDLTSLVAFEWQRLELVEADVSAGLTDMRGDSFRVFYLYLPAFPDDRGRPLPVSLGIQREDFLFYAPESEYFRAMGESLHAFSAAVGVKIAVGFALNVGGYLNLREPVVEWYGGGISYQSNCRCWGFGLTVRMFRGQDYPDVFFLLDLASLGSTGVGSNLRF